MKRNYCTRSWRVRNKKASNKVNDILVILLMLPRVRIPDLIQPSTTLVQNSTTCVTAKTLSFHFNTNRLTLCKEIVAHYCPKHTICVNTMYGHSVEDITRNFKACVMQIYHSGLNGSFAFYLVFLAHTLTQSHSHKHTHGASAFYTLRAEIAYVCVL